MRGQGGGSRRGFSGSGARFMGMNGFAMALEACCSLLLLLFSLQLLSPPGQVQEPDAPAFFLCSDAAALLAREGAPLPQRVSEISAISGLCIEAASGGISASAGCGSAGGRQRFSFSFPAMQGKSVARLRVSCRQA